jgi:hypothetical protein
MGNPEPETEKSKVAHSKELAFFEAEIVGI